MKRILFVGLIALMVLLVAPAMADTSAKVELGGPLDASLSIAANPFAVQPQTWTLGVGGNSLDWGLLHIATSNTGWAVGATTDNPPTYNQMYSGANLLQYALKQKDKTDTNYDIITNYVDSGTLGAGAVNKDNVLKYFQNVVDTDAAGNYQLKITYTIAAA